MTVEASPGVNSDESSGRRKQRRQLMF